MLKCADDKYYTGITNNLERRLYEHNEGVGSKCFTFKRRPLVLVYYQAFVDVKQAIALEKQIKGWSRKKKEAFIKQDFEELKRLSKRKANKIIK
jgi:putative endonuclease